MIYRLELSSPAVSDLADIIAWYRGLRPGLGAGLELCVADIFDRIRENPIAFPVVISGARAARMRRFPYWVLFRVTAARIEVLGLFHARRDPRAWHERAIPE